jgi:hypothetical protein
MTEPIDPVESEEARKQAEIEALADSIESTGTVSETPEGD